MKPSKLLALITKLSVYGVILLTPIFFLPFTFEYLEFNKQYLLAALVLVGVLAWIGRAIIEKEVRFYRTPLDIPLVAFWFIVLVSGVLSQDRNLSFLGSFDNLTIGVIPITLYILFYFLVTNTLIKLDDMKRVNILVLSSGLVASLFFFLQTSGVLNAMGLPWRFHNTVSSLNTPFGVFAITCLVLALNALFVKKKDIKSDIFWFVSFVASLIVLLLVGFKIVWIAAAAALFLLLVLGMSHLEEIRTSWVTVSFAILVIALIFVLLGVPQFLTAKLPLEVTLSQSASWKLATETLGSSLKQFILGSGPATFSYDFAQFRPESLNLTFAWNVRFAHPASTFIDLLATHGFLGTVSFVLVILLSLGTAVFVWMKKSCRKDGALSRAVRGSSEGDSMFSSSTLFFGMTVGWLSLLAASFFLVFSTTLWMLFFLYMGGLMVVARHLLQTNEKPFVLSLKTSPQYALASSFIFILVFSGVIVSGIFLGRFYLANVFYASSVKAAGAGEYDITVEKAVQATRYQPSLADYHVSLARAYLLQAAAESRSPEPDAAKVTNLIALAVNEARVATDLAPRNVKTWETLVTMYENAYSIAPNAVDWAVAALDKTVELESSNAVHFLRRGNLRFLLQKYDDAKSDYEEAIRLKANYIDAFVRLSILEEVRQDLNAAIMRMSDAFRFAPQDPEILFQLGRMLYNRGAENDLMLAEQAFRGAVQFNPNHANALYSLGTLLERQGNKTEALGFYRRVLQLNPDNEEVRVKVRALSAPTPAPPPPSPDEE
ncbi:MAG: tetratricopeptide repeat protein [Patescibacteria group bacterium]|nr:tetratricopeptide repeat protein [Patescibacteria group bacterium]